MEPPLKKAKTTVNNLYCTKEGCNKYKRNINEKLCYLHAALEKALRKEDGDVPEVMENCDHPNCTNPKLKNGRGRLKRCEKSCMSDCTKHLVDYCKFHFTEAPDTKTCRFPIGKMINGKYKVSCGKRIHHTKAFSKEHGGNVEKKTCPYYVYNQYTPLSPPKCGREIVPGQFFCSKHQTKCQFQGCGKLGSRMKMNDGMVFCEFHFRNKICRQKGCKEFVSLKDLKHRFCVNHSETVTKCRMRGCERLVSALPGCKPEEKVCTLHGGGKRCKVSGCTKVIVQGLRKKDYCRAHAYEMTDEFCTFTDSETKKMCMEKRLPGPKPLCKKHGGGGSNLCQMDGCLKVRVRLGKEPYCMSHGGGLKCLHEGCTNNAITGGGGKFCVKHGGGHRCEHDQCSKVALFGGKPFCREHGGGVYYQEGNNLKIKKYIRPPCVYKECTTPRRTKEGFCTMHSKFKDRESNRKPLNIE